MTNETRKIIDPHFHLWDLSQEKYAWLGNDIAHYHIGDYDAIRKDYLLPDYLAESTKYQIEKSVHVQCGWDSKDPVGETEWLQSIADHSGQPNGIVGYVDFTDTNYEQCINEHRKYANFRGVRQIINYYSDDPYNSGCGQDYLSMPQWRENIKILAKYNLSFDMQINPEQIDSAVELIADNPKITFILDHFCMAKDHSEAYRSVWEKKLEKLKPLENVYMKLSGFGMFEHKWTKESISPFIIAAIRHLGTKRCMFASNFPVDKLYKSFDQMYDIYSAVVAHLTPEEQDDLFYRTAETVYRL